MKKIAIYGLTALMGVAFAACDNYDEPNPQPQTNEQGVVLEADQVVFTNTISGENYNLATLSGEGRQITVATFEAPELGDLYSYTAEVEMSANGFQNVVKVPATVVKGTEEGAPYTVVLNPDQLQGLYYKGISKDPGAKTVELRYNLYTVSANGQRAHIGDASNVYGPFTLNLTPFPSTYVIEQAYYLVGTATDWEVAKAIKFNHSSASPYDDPVFTLKVDIESGWQWKIIPESTFVTGDWSTMAGGSFGVESEGEDSLGGMLFAQTEGGEVYAGTINENNSFLITINMEELTYSFDYAFENLYTPGNSNGWSQPASQLLFTSNYADYEGFAHLNGEFKLTSAPDWNGVNYGAAADKGKLSTDAGAGNLNAPADGLYYVKANISSLTYSLTDITTFGIIGSATPLGWDASSALTPSADFLTWTGTFDLVEGELKFRCNDAWDINLGGETDNLTPNGANIPVAAAGKYTVTLHLDVLPYSCEITPAK